MLKWPKEKRIAAHGQQHDASRNLLIRDNNGRLSGINSGFV